MNDILYHLQKRNLATVVKTFFGPIFLSLHRNPSFQELLLPCGMSMTFCLRVRAVFTPIGIAFDFFLRLAPKNIVFFMTS